MSVQFDVSNGISQIFYVKDETGIFLSAIDLFFSNKDENIPVTIQLRNVVNGSPGNQILPFSEVVVDPDDIELSADGTEPTRIKFKSPVYLDGPNAQDLESNAAEQRKQYALTITSPSNKYDLFIARTSSTSLQTGQIVSENFGNVGQLFQSQNSTNWIPSNNTSLTFNLLRCSFETDGLVRFFNPKSSINNEGYAVTGSNQFRSLSKKIIVGLSSNILDSNVVPGVTIIQDGSTANLTGVGGTAITLGVVDAGIGYTAGTFTNVSLITSSGFGDGATADITINSSGEVSSATITNGGTGYNVGDVLELPQIGSNIGYGGLLSVESAGLTRQFELSDVQGQFVAGLGTVYYLNSGGTATSVGAGITITSITEDPYYDGLHLQVYQPNHGMHSPENYVEIRHMRPPNEETHSNLSSDFSEGDVEIFLDSTVNFDTFESQSVSGTNPGYVIIGREVIEYTGTTSNSLTGITRAIDGSFKEPTYESGAYVYQYEFAGVSLRRLNKVHNFANVDRNIHDFDLDSYHIKIDPSTSGKDRSVGSNKLFFNTTQALGEEGTLISQNLQYSTLSANIKHKVLSSTSITPRIKTFTGTSVNGNEISFRDAGYVDFNLESQISFNEPRTVFSTTNEENANLETPGNRSLELEFYMTSSDERVSPFIDLEDASVQLQSNRINKPITNFKDDDRVRSFYEDPHEAIYISKTITIDIPANSLKVFLSCGDNEFSDIRVLYKITRPDTESLNWEFFPGYSNYVVGQDGIKRVIDPSQNDGTPDYEPVKETSTTLTDYQYTVDDLPEFTGFAIKIIMSSTNQSMPPFLDNLRVIATTKPSL